MSILENEQLEFIFNSIGLTVSDPLFSGERYESSAFFLLHFASGIVEGGGGLQSHQIYFSRKEIQLEMSCSEPTI